MAFLDKIGGLAKNIGDKASDTIETTKLNAKINSEKSAINDCFKQIGEIFYQKYAETKQCDPDIAELCASIDERNQNIATAQNEIEKLKKSDEASAFSTPASDSTEGIACVECGATNLPGTKFCSECGNKLDTPSVKGCPDCGAELPVGAKFCGECGYKF